MTRVEIFSGPGCAHCERAKTLLTEHGVSFADYDVSQPAHREAFARRLPRARSIPQIFIDGTHIGNDEDLAILARDGKLETLKD